MSIPRITCCRFPQFYVLAVIALRIRACACAFRIVESRFASHVPPSNASNIAILLAYLRGTQRRLSIEASFISYYCAFKKTSTTSLRSHYRPFCNYSRSQGLAMLSHEGILEAISLTLSASKHHCCYGISMLAFWRAAQFDIRDCVRLLHIQVSRSICWNHCFWRSNEDARMSKAKICRTLVPNRSSITCMWPFAVWWSLLASKTSDRNSCKTLRVQFIIYVGAVFSLGETSSSAAGRAVRPLPSLFMLYNASLLRPKAQALEEYQSNIIGTTTKASCFRLRYLGTRVIFLVIFSLWRTPNVIPLIVCLPIFVVKNSGNLEYR